MKTTNKIHLQNSANRSNSTRFFGNNASSDLFFPNAGKNQAFFSPGALQPKLVFRQTNDVLQRAPIGPLGPGTTSMHEDLTKQYSEDTGVPYEPGLQYTTGYQEWLAARNAANTAGSQPEATQGEADTPEAKEATKPKGDKTKTEVNASVGGTSSGSGTANVDGSLKVPLGLGWPLPFKSALKLGVFGKMNQSLSGLAKEKLEAGVKAQFDFLDIGSYLGSNRLSLTTGITAAGSGGTKTEDGKSKSFGSLQTGLSLRIIYSGDTWEASGFVTGGYSMFGADGSPLVHGGFLNVGSSIYLRGNVGSDTHKILFGPSLDGGYRLDTAQGTSEGYIGLSVRLTF